MNYIGIGSIIKEYRKRAGLTQAQLCEGLCEPPTMNKIENGKQNPNKKLLDAIVQRLQIPLLLNVPVTKVEFERARIEADIEKSFSLGNYSVRELLREYESVADKTEMNRFEKQFYMFANAVYLYKIDKNLDSALNELNEAMLITYPDYERLENLNSHLFTDVEFNILNNISICLYFKNENSKAISLLRNLLFYLERKKVGTEEFKRKYPMITYNLSMWLGMTKQYDEALSVSKKGIDFCLKYECYSVLPDLFYNTGYTHMLLHRNDEAIENLRKSLALDSIFGKSESLSYSLTDLKESFQSEFIQKLRVYPVF